MYQIKTQGRRGLDDYSIPYPSKKELNRWLKDKNKGAWLESFTDCEFIICVNGIPIEG
ncbi:hypothetical protein S-CBS2_gp004 [Synechococcus phage S-CBS2]|uniref:hypothetical protein n=1 Tax=Synechococcus phage S-CBS2 TaxID=753084 RepID=UPI00020783DD|nr:hypothetical protein S-CBS2_gp004 [Synechococcus phage S-CBS2]ADF42360.1 hypothetical protein S-CBS2_gp004 [Synechococcus phage S-CBS2]